MAYVPVSMRQKPQEAQTKVTTVKTGGYKPVAERKAKNKEVLDSIKKSTPFMLPNLNRILTAPNKPYIPSIPVGGTANSTQAIADKTTPDTIKMIKGTGNLISTFIPTPTNVKDVAEGFKQGVPQAVSGFQQGLGNVLDTLAENAGGKSKEAQLYQRGADALKRKADENYTLGKNISTDFGAKGITPLLQDPDFSKVFFEDKEFAKRMMDKYATEEEKTGDTKSFLDLIQDGSVARKMVAKNLPNLVIGAGTGLATTIATGGNVPAGVASAFAVTGTMEGGNAINEAKEFLSRHPDQAFRDLAKDEDYLKNIGTAVGIINGALEVLPIANLLKRIPAGNEIKSRVARIVLNRLIVGGLTQSALEGGTETIQELVGNAVKQVYDADQGLFEGVGEAGILGAVTGGGVSLATDVGISGYDKSKAIKAYYDTLSPREKQAGFINFGIGAKDWKTHTPKPKFGGFIDPRNKTEVFVTATKGDKQVYYTIPKGQEASIVDAVDGTTSKGMTKMKMADGWTYHITANPERVKEVYKNKGKITLGQINALKRKSGIVLDSEMDQTQQRIVENISKDEVEQLLKRAYPFVSDFYDSFEDWMEQDSNTIDLEVESNDVTLARRSEKLRERAEVPDGKGYRGDVSLSEIIDLYKEGKLTKSTANLDAPRRTDIKTDSSVQPTLTQPFSPKVDSTVAVESLKQLYETANQRVASSNREAVQKARLDLFVQYNANPNLASDLGVTPAELNKKIRTMAGFPASGASVQRDLNQGVAPQYQWIGISNSSYITKQSLEAKDVDPMVKKVTDKTAKWGQPDGKMLRDYILRTMFAIDTRISYADLTFKVESLERALGQYNNQRIEITINTGSSNTVAHEIGHYLDYKWAREIGFDNSLTELTQAGFNKQMIQERYNLSDEHMAWVESFKDFSYRLSNVSDLGRDNKSASYRQNPTETFARFVDKFVQWTNKQAGVREWAESGYYNDKFTESQFREFVTLLQEKAFLDAKYSIKYDPREGAKTSRKVDIKEERTYHGTPHKWEKPDLTKIGTGEGAIAYGWGFYLTQVRGIADDYRRNLSEKFIPSSQVNIEKYNAIRLDGTKLSEILNTEYDSSIDGISSNLDILITSINAPLPSVPTKNVSQDRFDFQKRTLSKIVDNITEKADIQLSFRKDDLKEIDEMLFYVKTYSSRRLTGDDSNQMAKNLVSLWREALRNYQKNISGLNYVYKLTKTEKLIEDLGSRKSLDVETVQNSMKDTIEEIETHKEMINRKVVDAQEKLDHLKFVSGVVDRTKEITADPIEGVAGYLYEIELEDDAVSTMIRWDERYEDQPKVVQEAWQAYKKENKDKLRYAQEVYQQTEDKRDFGHLFYFDLTESMSPQYGQTMDTKKMASEWLVKHGVKGVKYKTGTTRNNEAKTPEYNFVVFDTDDIKVLKRNNTNLSEDNDQVRKEEASNEYATNPDQTFYHGTLADFDKFDSKQAGKNTEWDNAKFGIFFIDDKARAEQFIEDTRTAGDTRTAKVKEVQLDIKNPLDLTVKGITTKASQAKFLYEMLWGEGEAKPNLTNEEALAELDDAIDLDTINELHDGLYSDIENKQKMIDAGYDGIVSVFGRDNGKTILEYVAFNDSQIKIKSPRSKGSDIGEAPEGWKETNQVARERFDIPKLEKISFGGSDRDVYKLEGNKVLKVAKSARGLAQNRVALDWYAQSQGLIPKVFEAGDNYIVSEYVGKPDARTKKFVKDLNDAISESGARQYKSKASDAYNIVADKYWETDEELAQLAQSFGDYDVLIGDLGAIRNWGTKEDGTPVMVDEGTLNGNVVTEYMERSNAGVPYTIRRKKDMSDPEFVGVYNRSKTARKNYGDTDGKTKYSEAPTVDPAIFKKRFTELTEEEKNQVLEAGNNKGLSEELQMRAYLIEQKQEAIENSVYKQLLKYKVPNRKNINKVFKNFRGRLPEVTGFAYAQINNVKELPYMEFMRAGDEIVGTTEFESAGITDTEQAREGFDKWLSDLEDLRQMKREFMTEKRQYIEKRNINEAMVTQIRKRVRDERRGAKIEGKRIRSRQKEVKAYINALNLEPAEKRKIQGNRSIDLMKEAEYEEFLDALEQEARKIQDKRQAKNELEFTIFDKGLSKVENLQKALKLPTITNMTAQQLRDFDELLQQYKTGDEFLTVRQIETVDNTDLKGIKTLREARERLAVDVSKVWKETVTGDDLKNIKVAPVADRIAYDADLATKNPFYALMVNEWNKAYVKAEANYYATEKKINELTKKARASRKRSLADKLIPTDKVVFQYMETPDADKAKFATENKMTPEELALADFMKKDYEVKRDYLVQMEVLKHYRQDYITHIRRGFLETWKEDNLITAFKELFEQYQQDEAVFNIMDGETGNILPLEKFFKYSMKRTGGLKPTNNVASAFLSYDKQFQKKLMLDSIVPKLDIYAHSITPKNKTPKGLEMDKTIRNFMTEWINTKKGRTTSRMALPQGSRSDIILRGLNGFLTIIDLGLNIPVGIASQFGEQISTYQALGTKAYSKGVVRLNSEKGKAFVKKYESFIGRSPWEELFDSTNTIGDQTLDAMFILFRDATIRANKIFTLGALTKEEYESGEISTERLAEIRNLMSSVRVVDEAKSIYGATSVGGVFTKYKTWAIPHLLTTRRNIINLTRQFREKGVTDIQKSPEAQQLLRMIMITGTIALVVGSAIDDDDDSFTGRLLRKAYQDSLTQMGSLDPAVIMSVPRLLTFLEDVGTAISEIIRLEEYKSGEKKGTLKGDNKLYNTLSPALVDQITKSVTEDNASTTDQVNQVKTKGTGGMPAVPKKKSEKKNLPPIPKSSQK